MVSRIAISVTWLDNFITVHVEVKIITLIKSYALIKKLILTIFIYSNVKKILNLRLQTLILVYIFVFKNYLKH